MMFFAMISSPAHPRSRGENAHPEPVDRAGVGSSPLTRGKQQRLDRGSVAPRLIPAHAGKTTRAVTRLRALSAHPRSRGENISTVTGGIQSAGSSPLTRGKRSMPRPHVGSRRLIPAHAGKTLDNMFLAIVSAAHPRSRGENSTGDMESEAALGSSPLTRGKRIAYRYVIPKSRLIPAHAGKTVGQCTRRTGVPAHPRSRGENAPTGRPRPSGPGSSPLTRGKRARRAWSFCPLGLIPAHAGKTPPPMRIGWWGAAHPRSRGENSATPVVKGEFKGSSPLTRGKRRPPTRG